MFPTVYPPQYIYTLGNMRIYCGDHVPQSICSPQYKIGRVVLHSISPQYIMCYPRYIICYPRYIPTVYFTHFPTVYKTCSPLDTHTVYMNAPTVYKVYPQYICQFPHSIGPCDLYILCVAWYILWGDLKYILWGIYCGERSLCTPQYISWSPQYMICVSHSI